MSKTINHNKILQYARSEQWEAMKDLVGQVDQAHVRQAFYVLCKEGNCRAVDILSYAFQGEQKFLRECITAGLKHHITVDVLKILLPLAYTKKIKSIELLTLCAKNTTHADELLAHLISWHDPQQINALKNALVASILSTAEGSPKGSPLRYEKSFFEYAQHWDFSDIAFSSAVLQVVLHRISDQERFLMCIGEQTLRKIQNNPTYTQDKSTWDQIEAYCSLQQRKRIEGGIHHPKNQLRTRKM